MGTPKEDNEKLAAVGLGLGILGLAGLAVGTKTGRQVSGGLLDGLLAVGAAHAEAAAEEVRKAHEIRNLEHKTDLQKRLLDMKLTLAKLNASPSYENYYKGQELKAQIKVLEEHLNSI